MPYKKVLFFIVTTFFLFTATAQKMNTYDKPWKKIDSLLQKGLPASALTEIDKIYALAKKEKNDVQVIKALIYRTEVQKDKEGDEALKKSIGQLEKEIAGAEEPARSVLQNIVARLYWDYFQNNRWKFYDRTQTVGYVQEDMDTWSSEDLHKKIAGLFLASLQNEKLLQQTKLDGLEPILIKGNVRYLRPTLFDLLANRALGYFESGERYLDKPADAFEIDDPAAFADAQNFAAHTFKTTDSGSLHIKALQLYQRLIRFHLHDVQPDALIDADIDRIAFVNNYAVMDDKKALYRKALEGLTALYGNRPIAAQAWYRLADSYADDARTYEPFKDTTYRYDFLKALAICERVAQQKDSSEGRQNCMRLLNEIKQPSLNLTTEKIMVPGQAFRVLVDYRNVTELYVRVIKIDKATKDKLAAYGSEEEYRALLVKLPALKTFTQTLPDTKDHQQHKVEIKAEGLPVGEYAFVAGPDKDFRPDGNIIAFHQFYSSNLSYINKEDDYYVLHRETGVPLNRVTAQVWYRVYDATTRKYVERKGETGQTDKDGHVSLVLSKVKTDRQYRIEWSAQGDHLYLDDIIYNNIPYETNTDRSQNRTFLFTDRAIYRPGQTVYFKGIVINSRPSSNQNAILQKFKTTLVLQDANGQKVDSVKLTTNDYGSYSGKFTLPVNVLNGAFEIVDAQTNSQVTISVEEYKRPKFYVEMNPPAGTYKLNDSIAVKGNAKAYAGNNIDGATVQYRVVRNVIMPWWYMRGSKMIWPPRHEEKEIAHGTVVTEADGSFIIPFKALPDLSVDKKGQPVFQYTVSVDITDINGETRSGRTTLSVAWQALQLHIDAPDKLRTDSIKNVKITSTNFNDLFEQATVTLTVYKLKTPDRTFRNRYWVQPDQFVMTQAEYYASFPYDVYTNEDEPANWEKGEQAGVLTDTTTASGWFALASLKLPAGWYIMEAITKDKYGETVKAIQYIQLYDQVPAAPSFFGAVEAGERIVEPGGTVSYTLATNVDSVYMIHETGRKNAKEERKLVLLNKNSQSFELPVSENDRGGLGIQVSFVKHNRVYNDNVHIDVPYSNKELSISYTSFRDKTLPGSEEKWKVKISGYKGDQVAAEMLTAMYDASLDEFRSHDWYLPDLWQHYSLSNWEGIRNFTTVQSREHNISEVYIEDYIKNYDQLLTDNFEIAAPTPRLALRYMKIQELSLGRVAPGDRRAVAGAVSIEYNKLSMGYSFNATPGNYQKGDVATFFDTAASAEPPALVPAPTPQPRKNFNETAFFFPDLHTDSAGNIEFSFTMPEALTKWKWMSLAHTKDLALGFGEKSIITQKELMVQPNAPRFLREGDRMDFSGKIVNLSDKELTGQVELQLIDATTHQSVDGWFRNVFPNQFFTVAAGQSTPVSFSLEIPYQYNRPVIYRMIATTKAEGSQGALSDGEENTLPVVSNRMLVTESLPLPVRGNGTKPFTFDKLLQSGNSETLNQHALTVEFTSNPAWYAIQALPYLMEYPYECAEQVFNRYYANTLAATIANSSPRIKAIFERWKTTDTSALLSNLQKNEELKAVLLQETPWVLQAKSEAQQKRNIALLFDMVRLGKERDANVMKLQDMQLENGGFAWFKGGRDDRYITQYILTGIGHLKRLKALNKDARIEAIVKAAIPYIDKMLKDDYDYLVKHKIPLTNNNLSSTQIQYLYMRSFFSEYAVPGDVFTAYNYYRKQSQQFWLKENKYMQGMIALSLKRTGDNKTAFDIVKSLRQNALVSEEMGMYWKDMSGGYYWYQNPIESQALLIEAFTEVTQDSKAVADMKTWLLKQKQTQDWKTTKATAEACYALLLQGTDWLANAPEVQISLGNYTLRSNEQQQEAGTGYFKKVIDGKDVKPAMGNIKVSVAATPAAGEAVSWGAVYWQYFENLDKITTAATPLKLAKKLFIEKNTDRGPVLEPVNEGAILHVGDKIKVRIELRADRNMEYVHMKDMRAACMEPVNVLSSYKWQGGLGYYESTKDASTNFFFGYLPKGTWVFEYALFVTHTGTFSNGVTSIQCMYAPEFTSHSEGIKVNVEAK